MGKFRRKAFDLLKDWKVNYAPNYAALLEGARRVGKSTIAEEFAKQNYRSYIKIDFANIDEDLLSAFKDIAKLDVFFLRLQTITGINLYPRESVIIFDEIQLNPKARQAIKYLIADGRYDYIETGSLITIKKNVKDIVIPSEEYKIPVYPMDYEEFLWAIGNNTYDALRQLYKTNSAVGNGANRSLMRDFRIYMAVVGLFGIQIACQQTFVAIGNAKTSFFLACLRKILLLIPLIYILPHFFADKAFAVFLAEPAADLLAVSATVCLFAKQFRQAMSEMQGKFDSREVTK